MDNITQNELRRNMKKFSELIKQREELDREIQELEFKCEQIEKLPATVRHTMWRFKDLILKYRTKDIRMKYTDLEILREKIEQLKEKRLDFLPQKSEYAIAITDIIINNSMNAEEIENMLDSMPLRERSEFVDESVMHLIDLSHKFTIGRGIGIHGTDFDHIIDLYEGNIEKEVKEKMQENKLEDKYNKSDVEPIRIQGWRNHWHLFTYSCIDVVSKRIHREQEKRSGYMQSLKVNVQKENTQINRPVQNNRSKAHGTIEGNVL